MRGFALGLDLKQRRKATWKSPISISSCSSSEKGYPIKLQNDTVLLFEQRGTQKKQGGAPRHPLSVGKPLHYITFQPFHYQR